jgi:hypothetical protein
MNLVLNLPSDNAANDWHLHLVSKANRVEPKDLADKQCLHVIPLFFQVLSSAVLVSELIRVESSVIVPLAAITVFEAPFAQELSPLFALETVRHTTAYFKVIRTLDRMFDCEAQPSRNH